MGHTAKLVWGKRSLDLNSGGYRIAPNFVPPQLSRDVSFSGVSFSNRYDGATAIDTSLNDRIFSFGIHITGSTEAEIRARVGRLQAFLNLAHDEQHPLYLSWRGNNDFAYEPLWGQCGASMRYVVKTGAVQPSSRYAQSNLRTKGLPNNAVTLTVGPAALGGEQLTAFAAGGVYEDNIGATDGMSRGVLVCQAITNKFTVPTFETSSYPWVASAAGMVITRTTEPIENVLFGTHSLYLYNQDGASQYAYRSINVGNTNNHMLSAFVRRPDGAAVTSADCQIYYGSAKTTTFHHYRGGWYRARASELGVNAATSTGILVKAGRSVYVGQMQVEEDDHESPACFGDLLGHAWSGTAHGSTSTRAAGRLTLPTAAASYGNVVMPNQGTIRAVWRAPSDADVYPEDAYIFDGSGIADGFRGYFDTSDEKFTFVLGATTIQSAVTTFEQNDLVALHFVWSPTEFRLYVNGASAANSGTVVIPTLGSSLFIGSDNTPANQANGTIYGFTIYDQPMAAADVLADYTNLAPTLTDDYRVDWIPYIWSKDGDNETDHYFDATHDDTIVATGIPGDLPADTMIRVDFGDDGNSALVNVNAVDRYIPTTNTFMDISGTVVAGALGGEVQRAAVTTSVVSLPTVSYIQFQYTTKTYHDAIRDKQLYIFCSLADAGTNLQARINMIYGGVDLVGDWQPITVDATLRQFLIGPTVIPHDFFNKVRWWENNAIYARVDFKRTTGGASNLDFDFYRILPGKTAYFAIAESDTGGVYIHGRYCYGHLSGYTANEFPSMDGDVIEFEPNKYNHIVMELGAKGGAIDLTDAMAIAYAYVTPRWSVMG